MRKLLILSLLLTPLVLNGGTPKLPPDKELKALVRDTLLAFNKAVQEKNFTQFHTERFSPQFREQFPLDKFTAAFQTFIDKGYDIANIAKSDPIFDSPPAIDKDGLLDLRGRYETRPNKVTFNLTFIYTESAWKLLVLNVEAEPEDAGKVPSKKELKTLTLDSLLLFNTAVQTKNFEAFYAQIAKLWQKQVTPQELMGIFQSFIDKGIDIGSIAKLEPTFEDFPEVNKEGVLVVGGSYPTQPSKVFFELKYFYEAEGWKLMGINVQVKPTSDKADKNSSMDDSDEDEDDDGEE